MDKKKILIVATVWGFFNFLKNDMELLKANGYEVHCATNFKNVNNPVDVQNVIKHQIDFSRNPLSQSNVKAFRQLSRVMADNKFTIVHCHTPVGGVVARLIANKYRKKGTKVYYTAHGFHFYTGAPLLNWLVYYPVEWLCSWKTDLLITINKEDYHRAKKHFHAKNTSYIPGVGVDVQKFGGEFTDRGKKRRELGILEDEIMILSVGELSKRKNHQIIIKAMEKLQNRKIRYFIAGEGKLRPYLQRLIEDAGLTGSVCLLGQRKDIPELCRAADLFVFPSLQEGLPVALMEAMASGLPCICSDIRGNHDLIVPGKGGYLVTDSSVQSWATAVKKMLSSDRKAMGEFNRCGIKAFSIDKVQGKIEELYLRNYKKQKLAFFLQYADLCASSQYRVLMYKDKLNKDFHTKYFYFWNNKYVAKYMPDKKRYMGKIFFAYIINTFRRIFQILFLIPHYDILVIQRCMIPYIKPTFISHLKKHNVKIVYDIDDALHLNGHYNCRQIARKADCIITGSQNLKEFYLSLNENVLLVPTVDNEKKYTRYIHDTFDNKCIGWIGSFSTIRNLDSILDSLNGFIDRHPEAYVKIISNDIYEYKNKIRNCKFVQWNKDTYISEMQEFTIGIMPLDINQMNAGKCGFKLIQYLDLQKPVIATDLGENKTIVKEYGLLCRNEEQWREALETILCSRPNYNNFVNNIRHGFLNDYGYDVNYKRLHDILSNI